MCQLIENEPADIELRTGSEDNAREASSTTETNVLGAVSPSATAITAADIQDVLVAHSWLAAPTGDAAALQEIAREDDAADAMARLQAWLARAAELLAPYAKDGATLEPLLRPIFEYDAAAVLRDGGNQAALAREGAREVIRALANQLLEKGEVDSGSFKEIIDMMKLQVPYRSRDMFHPVRLVLTGRTGEGELDRVILLLDAASKIDFAVPVKTARQRLLEFCAAFD